MNFFDAKNSTLAEIKARYRVLCKLHHPDRVGGDVERMKAINTEYHKILKCKLYKPDEAQGTTNKEPDFKEINFDDVIKDTLQKISHLEGLECEVVGSWIWITGEERWTRSAAPVLKENKFRWHKVKQRWYFNPEPDKKFYGKATDYEEIKEKYGYQKVHFVPRKKVTKGATT
jgi:hypothetical protein